MGAGGLFEVHHSGTQRDLSDTQTAPKQHGGAAGAAQHQERHDSTVRQPVSLGRSFTERLRVCSASYELTDGLESSNIFFAP